MAQGPFDSSEGPFDSSEGPHLALRGPLDTSGAPSASVAQRAPFHTQGSLGGLEGPDKRLAIRRPPPCAQKTLHLLKSKGPR